MKAPKDKMTLLVDMDAIMVDMTPTWLELYRKETGERIRQESIKSWDFRGFVSYPNVLDEVLARQGFFFNLKPIKDCVKYASLLMKKRNIDFVIVTQPPRKSSFACEDKRRWLRKYFPEFNLSNLVLTHRKNLIFGDLIFDDNPDHLMLTRAKYKATIDYPYNSSIKVDFRLDKETAWKSFYKIISEF